MANLRLLALTSAFVLLPVAAQADPITSFFAFFSSASLGALTVAPWLGRLALAVVVNAVGNALTPKPKIGSNTPNVADAQVNVRLETAERWQLGGTVAVGGSLGCFAEFDANGNFWYIVAHGDAELTGTPSYILDGIPVTLSNGTGGFLTGQVLTNDFCINQDGQPYDGTGTKIPMFRLYTVTPSAGSVYGALPSDFTSNFSALPADFFLAGVCYTIVLCGAIERQNYSNLMKWRGGFGLGEPSVVMVGNFNRMYDPRNGAHDINNPATWTASNGNPAIIWAWFRTSKFGRNRPMTEINWTQVAAQANICDITVLDRSSVSTPLYRCGVAFPDSKPRWECEQDILASMDGFVAYDEAGLAYPVAGYYTAPTLEFTAARDIISAQTMITDDGETAVDGVVVYYIDPNSGYTRQPCAPWKNPDWYSGSAIPNYYQVDILACQNHNQAVRLAKAIGTRIAATKRAALGTTIKGILATRERNITLTYDAEFNGVYEIVSPIEEDAQGISCSFTVVPMASTKWLLSAGEEGAPPGSTPALGLSSTIASPTGVVLTSDGAQIKATFTAPSRGGVTFSFRYRKTGTSDDYQYFNTNMKDLTARSAVVINGQSYDVSYAALTASGRSSGWSGVTAITVRSNPTAPAALASSTGTGGVGTITQTFTTANDANQYAVALYRGTTNVFGAAALIRTVYLGPNTASSSPTTGLAAGTYYVWAVPLNNSGVAGTASGPHTCTVT